MRIMSNLLFAIAAAIGGCAILAYGYLKNLACGYAPRASGCARPWDLGSDDRFWLLGVPTGIVVFLIVLALLLRRKSHRSID